MEKLQQRQVAHPPGSIALPPTLWQSRGVIRSTEPPRSRGAMLRRTATPITQAPTTLHRVAMLGNHLPRQCGIATFTTDLSTAIRTAYPALDCMIIAMNDAVGRHAYPAEVRFEINAPEVAEYQKAADFINHAGVDVLSVQHEYGIFGGAAGAYLLGLLREVNLPVVTTLHTILAAPDDAQRAVMDELTQRSARLVVMSAAGAALLHQVHNVPLDKIDLIPHGIPALPHAQRSKTQLGFDDKLVMLTFGLLSPDKGIEHVIDAMPAIVAQHPNAIYVILGATHPHVKAHAGEAYREMLQARARMLGVAANVVFANRFVSQHELNQYLAAADIYLTPYLKPEQSTSGTLAYAVGAGKAVVSTPYAYARELLANDRGVLVPWPADDPTAIAREVQGLLGDPERRQRMRARGTAFGRSMLWPAVATGYVHSFERARISHAAPVQLAVAPRAVPAARAAVEPVTIGALATLPEIKLDHLRAMTDSCGMLQHASFTIPRYEEGYCLDDNARALLLVTQLGAVDETMRRHVRAEATRYLAFVRYAFNASTGRFRNFMSFGREWLEAQGSEDSHGRAVWSLAAVSNIGGDAGRVRLATELFHAALPATLTFTSPRAWAFTLLGIDSYWGAHPVDGDVERWRDQLSDRLYQLYLDTSRDAWPWFEEEVTYCNARLPQALLVSGARRNHTGMIDAGLRALQWLSDVQTGPVGYFAPIGSAGFFASNGNKAEFDQQPVEAGGMVSACLAAARITGDAMWQMQAQRAMYWFLGENQTLTPLYDSTTGGCRDGLHAERPNENQGAEATLSFLLALHEFTHANSNGGAL